MELTTTIKIFYEAKVAQTGYRICSKKKCKVKHEGTRYTHKPFTSLTVHDFWMSCPDHPRELTDEMRLTFYDKWGVLKEENETEYLYKELVQKFLNIGDAHANNRLPMVRTTPELSWDINADGLLCPAIECDTLFDALLTSWQLLINKRGPDYITCLHYKTYGEREDCARSFKPKRSDAKHCSRICKDLYNQKKGKNFSQK
jgi:hypothetical protein